MIVNRAWPDNRDQSIIGAVQHAVNGVASVHDDTRHLFGDGELSMNLAWRNKLADVADASVIDGTA